MGATWVQLCCTSDFCSGVILSCSWQRVSVCAASEQGACRQPARLLFVELPNHCTRGTSDVLHLVAPSEVEAWLTHTGSPLPRRPAAVTFEVWKRAPTAP